MTARLCVSLEQYDLMVRSGAFDGQHRRVTVFRDPENGRYQAQITLAGDGRIASLVCFPLPS